MTSIWFEFLLLPLAGRVALLLTIMWFIWLLFGKLIIRALSPVFYCLWQLFLVIYRFFDFPLGLLHSKFAGFFAHIDCIWTDFMRITCGGMQSWAKTLRHPKRHHRIKAMLLCCVLFVWIVIPGGLGLNNPVVLGAEHTYLKFEKWITEKIPVSIDLNMDGRDSLIPLSSAPTIEEPTPMSERVVTGLTTRLLVRNEPSVSVGKMLAYLVNDDIVYDLNEHAQGDAGDGKIESWLKIQTQDGITGWVREKYLKIIEID